MTNKEIINHFKSLTIWRRKDQRAPHKPLLVLLAIGYLQNNDQRLLSYNEVDPKLNQLLTEFGTPRNSSNTHYPFWRLRKKGIWEVQKADELSVNKSGDVKKTELREKNIKAGFTMEVYTLLKGNPSLRNQIATELLGAHFPHTIHEDIIQETGLSFEHQVKTQKPRDPEFRRQVLQAYEHRCAICDFDVRMGPKSICIEAAHIKWHSAGGPDAVDNGIALCTLHHKLFDLGAFTLTQDREFLVSEKVFGRTGFDSWLGRFHGDIITRPVRATYEPNVEYLAWNHDQVFKDPGREF